MRQKTKAMLLSGLVLPGLGQIYLGRKKLGAGIAFIILSSIFWLFIRIFFLTWRTVMVKGSKGMSINLSTEVFSQLHHQAWAKNWWLVLIIVLIWLSSIVQLGLVKSEPPL